MSALPDLDALRPHLDRALDEGQAVRAFGLWLLPVDLLDRLVLDHGLPPPPGTALLRRAADGKLVSVYRDPGARQ